MLLSAGVSGSVHVWYVVDTTGRVDMPSMKMESSHPLFASSIKAMLATVKLRQRAQPDRREELFVFSNANGAPPIQRIQQDTTADGVPRTTVGYPVLDTGAASTYDTTSLVEARRNVLSMIVDTIAAHFAGDKRPTFCLATPDTAAVRQLSAGGRRALPMAACPHTYTSMITTIDSLGRVVDPAPPGGIDPYLLSVVSVDPWTVDIVRVTVDVGHGTAGHRYLCGVGRDSKAIPVQCQVVRNWVS